MTSTDMLVATHDLLNLAVRVANPADDAAADNVRKALLSLGFGGVINALEDDIRTASARRQGKGTQTAACKRIIKNATRDTLKGSWIGTDGMQYVCDGYRAVRYYDPLPLPEAAGMDCTQHFCADDTGDPLDLPDVGALKALLIEHRANYADIPAKKRPPCRYDFGDGLPAVDAQYLIDTIDALPDATATAHGTMQPIQFRAPDGDAILLPLRKK